MQPIDLTNVLKDAPIGEWLALSFTRDRIVAHSPTLSEAKEAAEKLGEKSPIMLKAPPPMAIVRFPPCLGNIEDWASLYRIDPSVNPPRLTKAPHPPA